jgi:tRNA G10  N-methylase Trm11
MKYYALVNSGMSEVTLQEVTGKELGPHIIQFESESIPAVKTARRIVIVLAETNDLSNITFSQLDALPTEFKFKVEVENVKGQDNRIDIAKQVAGAFFEQFTGKAEIELKKPEHLLVVFREGEKYYMGFSSEVEEINIRPYRVFAHHASFRGDLAYYIMRKSGFAEGKKLLVGFCKDGSIAIEAALFGGDVVAFDEGRQNVTAAVKNAKIAKANVEIKKLGLDDIDVKFDKESFDSCIFHMTHKDEEKINELYYQTNYVLRKGGTIIVIGRATWEVSISEKFKLVEKINIARGESVLTLNILEKR